MRPMQLMHRFTENEAPHEPLDGAHVGGVEGGQVGMCIAKGCLLTCAAQIKEG